MLYTGADDAAFKAWDVRAPARHVAAAWYAPLGAQASQAHPGGDSGGLVDEEEEEEEGEAPPRCTHTNRKAHAAGVCTISPHPTLPHLLATGSYDERVLLWDTREATRPLAVTAACATTGGGNWRLRWHPTRPRLLLAACMYNGCAVLEATDAFDGLSVVEAYGGHGSIAYGADWFRLPAGGHGDGSHRGGDGMTTPRDVVATCSFYDRLLHVWSPCRL